MRPLTAQDVKLLRKSTDFYLAHNNWSSEPSGQIQASVPVREDGLTATYTHTVGTGSRVTHPDGTNQRNMRATRYISGVTPELESAFAFIKVGDALSLSFRSEPLSVEPSVIVETYGLTVRRGETEYGFIIATDYARATDKYSAIRYESSKETA